MRLSLFVFLVLTASISVMPALAQSAPNDPGTQNNQLAPANLVPQPAAQPARSKSNAKNHVAKR